MKNIFLKITDKYFGEEVDFRAKAFNGMTLMLFVLWMIASVTAILHAHGAGNDHMSRIATVFNAHIVAYLMFFSALLVIFLTWYANKTKKYQRCYWAVVIALFMVQVPIGFFLGGGYRNNGVVAGLVTAVVFTAFLFEGKKAIVVPLILVIEYTAISVYAYYFPESIHIAGERNLFFFNTFTFAVCCIVLGTAVVLNLKLHDRQRRELEIARQKAVEYEKLKTDFFGRMSHEYRTPLSVISASAEIADKHIATRQITDSTHDYLRSIKQEAMRLAGITSVTMASLRLPFVSRGEDGEDISAIQKRFTPVYINDLARIMSGIVKLAATQNEIALHVDTEEDMPPIRGDRETLITLMLNLLHNAVVHANCKNITISAYKKDRHARLLIEDDGVGIPKKLSKTIFNRGVSGNGGKGNGLYVCDKIVSAHRGNIEITNRRDGGARVIITFPLPTE